MLATLSGLATVKRTHINPETNRVSLLISMFDQDKEDASKRKWSGQRWLILNQKDSNDVVAEGGELSGLLIRFSAGASTSESKANVYFVNELQVLGGEDASNAVLKQQVTLKGVGAIVGIYPNGNLVKLLIKSTDGYGDNQKQGLRNITVFGNSAKYFIERQDTLIGELINFSAKATSTLKDGENNQTISYENYSMLENSIIYRKRKESTPNQQQAA